MWCDDQIPMRFVHVMQPLGWEEHLHWYRVLEPRPVHFSFFLSPLCAGGNSGDLDIAKRVEAALDLMPRCMSLFLAVNRTPRDYGPEFAFEGQSGLEQQ